MFATIAFRRPRKLALPASHRCEHRQTEAAVVITDKFHKISANNVAQRSLIAITIDPTPLYCVHIVNMARTGGVVERATQATQLDLGGPVVVVRRDFVILALVRQQIAK